MKIHLKILPILLCVLINCPLFSQGVKKDSVEDFLKKVKTNDLEGVKIDLKAGLDPNSKDTTRWELTALMIAAQENLPDMIALLIGSGAKVNEQNKSQVTALMYAAWRGNKEAVLKLFEYGADPNIERYSFGSAIQLTAARGTSEMVKILLDHGANVNDQNKQGDTILYWACLNGKLETMKLLISRGADVNRENKLSQTPLMAAESRGYTDVINVLHQVTAKEYLGDINHVLLGATRLGHYKLVEDLLKKGADVNTHLEDGYTPLLLACFHGDYGIYSTGLINMRITAKVLLEHGANPNIKSKQGQTPLIGAIEWGDTELVKLLLSMKAMIEPTPSGSDGVLHIACNSYLDNLEIVTLLLKHGAPINEKGGWGMTPLAIAAEQGQTKVVKYLLEHGADWRIKNERGRTVLWFAKQNDHPEVVKLLEDAGATD